MARKKKQSKKTRSRASTVRQDYRKGGRVKANMGGNYPGGDTTPAAGTTTRYARPDRREYGDEGGFEHKQALNEWEANERKYFTENPNDTDLPFFLKQDPDWNKNTSNNTPDNIPDNIPDNTPQDTTSTQTRSGDNQKTREKIGEALEGKVSDAAKIADPLKVDESIEQTTTTMDKAPAAQTFQASGQAPEAVRTEQTKEVDETIGQDLEAAKIEDVETIADQQVPTEGATGEVTRGPIDPITGEITAGVEFATVDSVKAEAAKARNVDDILTGTYLVDEVEGEDTTVSATPDAEKSERLAIIGEAASSGIEAAITDTLGYTAAKQRVVTGTAAQSSAAEMTAATANLPPEISAAIVQDPATVTAEVDQQPVEVQAAIPALPSEALVSAQMETLLGGMEDGEIPAWAKPAVAAVNQGMAARGLSVSTVGRDSLFNAIIQSALPMAQSNAQALQQRAAQNLSNEQQANLQQATQQQQLR